MAGIHTIRDLVDSVISVKMTGKNEIKITSDMLEDPSAKTRYEKKPITLYVGVETDQETYFSFYHKEDNERSGTMAMIAKIKLTVEDRQGITAGELKEEIRSIDTRVRDSMIGTDLIMHIEKNGRGGRDIKRFYTVDYYNQHKEEIEGKTAY